jgi:septal ring factor EnvC (AmiA/AmiB activator)
MTVEPNYMYKYLAQMYRSTVEHQAEEIAELKAQLNQKEAYINVLLGAARWNEDALESLRNKTYVLRAQLNQTQDGKGGTYSALRFQNECLNKENNDLAQTAAELTRKLWLVQLALQGNEEATPPWWK